jgi:hypothetical protein
MVTILLKSKDVTSITPQVQKHSESNTASHRFVLAAAVTRRVRSV